MSFDAPTGDPSALAEPPDYHGCVKTRATIRKKDIANDRRGHHSSAGSSRRDGDGPLRLTSAHSAPARTRTGLPRGLPATNGKTRQFLIVHTACDFCRSSNKSCQQPQLSRIRCGNCSRHHKRCTWGGLNLEGELYHPPSRQK
ncbi:hypothetical protein BV20DRAFT_960098 [Pilatotrama ljubarskyi]|nr:hypothetical protein BV20DRAFT_960098 [Pilatotrama ljubarskyi]